MRSSPAPIADATSFPRRFVCQIAKTATQTQTAAKTGVRLLVFSDINFCFTCGINIKERGQHMLDREIGLLHEFSIRLRMELTAVYTFNSRCSPFFRAKCERKANNLVRND